MNTWRTWQIVAGAATTPRNNINSVLWHAKLLSINCALRDNAARGEGRGRAGTRAPLLNFSLGARTCSRASPPDPHLFSYPGQPPRPFHYTRLATCFVLMSHAQVLHTLYRYNSYSLPGRQHFVSNTFQLRVLGMFAFIPLLIDHIFPFNVGINNELIPSYRENVVVNYKIQVHFQ